VFPKLLWMVAKTGSRELFTLCVIAAAVGIAYGSAMLFGVSFALGAFFAGVVLSESELSHRAAEESLPLRDAFSVLFFVSVGMLFDPHILLEQPLHVLAVVMVIIFGKTFAAMALVLFFRYPLNTALTVGASLAQIGEFSFILAGLGLSLGLLSLEGQNLILAGAMVSIALNSVLFTAIEPAQRWIRQRSHLARLLERSGDPLAMLPMEVDDTYLTGQVVLVGYGEVGRRIAARLMAQHIRFVVVDDNRDLIESLRDHDIAAVLGNAIDPAVLIQAHIHKASLLVVSIPDTFDIGRMMEIATTLNPQLETILCSGSAESASLLAQHPRTQVYQEKQTLADQMAEHVELRLGKHPATTDTPPMPSTAQGH
jgi:CPA2 family monovalent cation:H+ antiporter-2